MTQHRVRYLLMGEQACVLYGGAEFSRDTDLVVLTSPENLARLRQALADLQAECIAVPPFDPQYLDRGLAVHFRCAHAEAAKLRIDVMSKLRGVEAFEVLWDRRTTLEVADESIEVLALPDLVKAKKTQRDKDWPMIARLLEANYFQNRSQPTPEHIHFWLREMRTPSLLMEVAARFPEECDRAKKDRPVLAHARTAAETALQAALKQEEAQERAADHAYWAPLRRELEKLRQESRRKPKA